jgi:hypothetical protein
MTLSLVRFVPPEPSTFTTSIAGVWAGPKKRIRSKICRLYAENVIWSMAIKSNMSNF